MCPPDTAGSHRGPGCEPSAWGPHEHRHRDDRDRSAAGIPYDAGLPLPPAGRVRGAAERGSARAGAAVRRPRGLGGHGLRGDPKAARRPSALLRPDPPRLSGARPAHGGRQTDRAGGDGSAGARHPAPHADPQLHGEARQLAAARHPAHRRGEDRRPPRRREDHRGPRPGIRAAGPLHRHLRAPRRALLRPRLLRAADEPDGAGDQHRAGGVRRQRGPGRLLRRTHRGQGGAAGGGTARRTDRRAAGHRSAGAAGAGLHRDVPAGRRARNDREHDRAERAHPARTPRPAG